MTQTVFNCGYKEDCAYYKKLTKLEQENTELKTKLSSTKCYLCGESFLTPEGAELYEEKEKYRTTLQEIKAIANTRFVNGINQEADIYNAQMSKILDLITNAEEE